MIEIIGFIVGLGGSALAAWQFADAKKSRDHLRDWGSAIAQSQALVRTQLGGLAQKVESTPAVKSSEIRRELLLGLQTACAQLEQSEAMTTNFVNNAAPPSKRHPRG